MLLAAIALACAALIGFSAHRASLCNVRAVAELMTSGSAHMLWSLLQAMLWMATLTGVGVLAFGLDPQPAWARTPLLWAGAGGLLFGAGAAVNGGCSLSTLTRLADGELGMLATLAGFVAGVLSWLGVQAAQWPAGLVPVTSPWLRWPQFAPWLLLLLIAWALQRVWMFWRLSRGQRDIRALVLKPAYHLSVAAALMGLAAGLLYATQGAWSYTNYLRTESLHAFNAAPPPSAWHALLVLGMLAGMTASARQRRSAAWRWPGAVTGWARHAGGGALMGAGAAMLPGGNDTLLLGSLPTLTLAAWCAYASMLAGVALVLGGLRAARRPLPALACSASGCNEAVAPPAARSGP